MTDLLDAFSTEVLIEFTKFKRAGPSVMEIARANKTVGSASGQPIPQQGQGGTRPNYSDNRKRPRDDGEKIPYKDRVPCVHCGAKHLGTCNKVKDGTAKTDTGPSLGMKLNDHKVASNKSQKVGGQYGPGDRQPTQGFQTSRNRPGGASLKALVAIPGVASALAAPGAMADMDPRDKTSLSRVLRRIRHKANKKKGRSQDT